MGTAGAKAFGDMLLGNKTMQTLDVSDNSLGKVQVGDQVKLKSSGEMKVVTKVHSVGGSILVEGGSIFGVKPSEFEYEAYGIVALCAGVAASPSLISVSTTSRHASCSISHSSPHSHHVRSSMYLQTAWVRTAERPSPRLSLRIAPSHR